MYPAVDEKEVVHTTFPKQLKLTCSLQHCLGIDEYSALEDLSSQPGKYTCHRRCEKDKSELQQIPERIFK